MVNTTNLEKSIVDDLSLELGNEPTFSAVALNLKTKIAVRELYNLRNYSATSLTDDQILADMERFYPQLMNVVMYDYNLVGAEGENKHTENGISRSYVERQNLWNGVVAFAGVPKVAESGDTSENS